MRKLNEVFAAGPIPTTLHHIRDHLGVHVAWKDKPPLPCVGFFGGMSDFSTANWRGATSLTPVACDIDGLFALRCVENKMVAALGYKVCYEREKKPPPIASAVH
jgi:hypothetical protein